MSKALLPAGEEGIGFGVGQDGKRLCRKTAAVKMISSSLALPRQKERSFAGSIRPFGDISSLCFII